MGVKVDRQDDKSSARLDEPVPVALDAKDRRELEQVMAAAPPGSVITFYRVELPSTVAVASSATERTEESMKRWLTPKEVAERLTVKAATVRAWVAAGRFPGKRTLPNGAIRIPTVEVNALLDASRPTPAAPPAASAPARAVAVTNRTGAGGEPFDPERLSSWRSHLPPGHR